MKLGEQAIIKLASASKDEALREMSALAVRLEEQLSEEQVYKALVRREKIGSTGIGGGIAIPHAKVEGVHGKLLALGYSRKGIPYDRADTRPVEVMVLLLGEPGPNQDYLHALGKLGRMLATRTTWRCSWTAMNQHSLTRFSPVCCALPPRWWCRFSLRKNRRSISLEQCL